MKRLRDGKVAYSNAVWVSVDVALKARDSTGLVEKCVCNLIKLGDLCSLPM